MNKIYLSSSFRDLKEFRQIVYHALRKLRYDVVAMEDYTADATIPLEKCLADVADCDIYLGFFAWRYGEVIHPFNKSISELEYLKARELNKPCFIFMLDESVPWMRNLMDEITGEGDYGRMIQGFRDRLKKNHIVNFFSSPQDLVLLVTTSLARLREDQVGLEMQKIKKKEEASSGLSINIINLRPSDLGSFFKDRLDHSTQIIDFLNDDKTKIIFLIGKGGMGKTALACNILGKYEKQLKNPEETESGGRDIEGIIYLTAQGTTLTLERIYNDISKILGEPALTMLKKKWLEKGSSFRAKADFLLELMLDRKFVILLDNFETYLDEQGLIVNEGLKLFLERLLEVPFRSKILITSRSEVKRIGKFGFNIANIHLNEGLPVPDAADLIRDLDANNELGLNHAATTELEYLARFTFGVPRAIEILIGMFQQDPTLDLSKILHEPDLFRNIIVEQLFDEVYKRLDPDEKKVLEVLSVVNRPAGDLMFSFMLLPLYPGIDVKQKLNKLLIHKLVQYNRKTSEYSLHPLDQFYLYSRIQSSSEKEPFCLSFLERRAAEFYRNIRSSTIPKDYGDILVYLNEYEHWMNCADYENAFQTLEPIVRDYLFKWGYYSLIIELESPLAGQLKNKTQLAACLGNIGSAQYASGHVNQAIELLNKSFALLEEEDEGKSIVWLSDLGVAYYTLGEFNYAKMIFTKALELARKMGDVANEAGRLGHLALIERASGHNRKAISLYQEALALSRKAQNKELEGIQIGSLGTVFLETGAIEEARQSYEKALDIARDVKDKRREDVWLGHIGMIYSYLNETEKAWQYFQDALLVCREIDDLRHEVNWLSQMARICLRNHQLDDAFELYSEALQKAKKNSYNRAVGFQNLQMGKVSLLKEDFFQAKKFFENGMSFNIYPVHLQSELFLEIAKMRDLSSDSGKMKKIVDTYTEIIRVEKNSFDPNFITALAMLVETIVRQTGSKNEIQSVYWERVEDQYERSLLICKAPGIILDILKDLEVVEICCNHSLDRVKSLLMPYVVQQ